MEVIIIISLILNLIGIGVLMALLGKINNLKRDIRSAKGADIAGSLSELKQDINGSVNSSVRNFADFTANILSKSFDSQDKYLEQINYSLLKQQRDLQESILMQLNQQENRFKTFSAESEQRLDMIRSAVEKKLSYLQEDNNRKLEEIRLTVDEKLDDRMTKSFKLVEERLEQVYRGLGEMQSLAEGVGDLKKVLSNVKTRGVLGEIQLGGILEEILSPEQYVKNAATKKGTQNFVEFAIKIPTGNGETLYLPIDAKFPADAYTNLQDAYDTCDKEKIKEAVSILKNRIKAFAKDIRDKYLDPPYTTDFGIMFLPFEGLYAEVVNRGMVEVLQREYHVNIAGPSTMAALLNSLQMGFKTFAIEKRSAEVWKVLGSVKTEFDKFEDVLMLTQQRLEQANSELDKLVGVRTRQIRKTLSEVSNLEAGEN